MNVSTIFQAARCFTPEARAAFLDALCTGKPELRAEVDALLAADTQASAEFLEPALDSPPATSLQQSTAAHTPAPLAAGTLFNNRFKLREKVGEGGMGAVWIADQLAPVQRRVAIKIIKEAADTNRLRVRFEQERQALALMNHPNIAQVFDADVDAISGRPYFVMELIKGVPITKYCDDSRLSPRERLELFIPVCLAVQHAHQKGVIHRDLKPSNVLIGLYDGKPIAKVIDFGVAKATGPKLTEHSVYTEVGSLIGTLEYMSPEQAELNNLDIDTRTDVYALGVMLYELLTGSVPFSRKELEKAGFDEMRRLIREVDPPKPSTKISQSGSLPSLAACRKLEPRSLTRLVKGDLDWIVMKALEKDRQRRYETANGFARDIERFLKEEPVEASPPSAGYRLKKFVFKHRGKFAAAAVVFLSLVCGMVGTTWGLFRALAAEEAATLSENKALSALEKEKEERAAKEKALIAESLQREKAERQLVSGLLRTIGHGENIEAAELKGFADWSALNDARLQLLVLQTGLEEPQSAWRLARRAQRVIHSSVGLSPFRRAKAIELVSVKQRETAADPHIRIAACWLALELGSSDLPALAESIAYLSDPANNASGDFASFVHVAVEQTGSHQAADIDRALTGSLLDVLNKSTDKGLVLPASDAISALATRLEPSQVTQAWNVLVAASKVPTNGEADNATTAAMVVIALRLEKSQAVIAWNQLLTILKTSNDDSALRAAQQTFDRLARTAESDQTAGGWDALIVPLMQSSNPKSRYAAERGLASIAPCLEPKQRTKRWNSLLIDLENPSPDRAPLKVSEALSILAQSLEKSEVAGARDALVAILQESTNQEARFAALDALGELARRLEPGELALDADEIISRLESSADRYRALSAAEKIIPLLAPRLEANQAFRCTDALIAVLEGSTNNDYLQKAAGKILVALAPRLNASQAALAWDAVAAILAKLESQPAEESAYRVLSAFASRLEPSEVNVRWDQHVSTLDKAGDKHIPEVLSSLAPQLEAAKVALAVDALIAELDKSTDQTFHYGKRNLFKILASRLEPIQVVRIGDAQLAILEKSLRSEGKLHGSMETFTSIATSLEARQVAQAAEILVKALEQSKGADQWSSAVTRLFDLAPQLEPSQMSRVADTCITHLEGPVDGALPSETYDVISKFAKELQYTQVQRAWNALIGRLKALDGDSTAPPLSFGMFGGQGSEYRRYYERLNVRNAILALTPRLDLQDRSRAREAFLSMMDHSLDDNILDTAARTLAALAPNDRSVAVLLSHPASVGASREFLLERLEEFLFHDGKPFFAPQASTGFHFDRPPTPPPRRFHNIHDAAAWIKENWPDFDLECCIDSTQ